MQKNNPFFSVITCTLNSEKYVSKNIASVDYQTFKDYEHTFIDGGSSDSTIKILNQYKIEVGNRVHVNKYLKRGVSNAFNKGIEKSKGKYLIFLNSDDYFFDKKVLGDVYKFLSKHPECDWIYAKINVIENDGKNIGIFPLKKIFQTSNRRLMKLINFIPHQSVFIKKQIFTDFGKFDSKLKLNMDTDLFLKISPKTNWIFYNRIIANYTLRSDSLSSNRKNKKRALKSLEKVQARYLTQWELFFVKIVNRIVSAINKTYR